MIRTTSLPRRNARSVVALRAGGASEANGAGASLDAVAAVRLNLSVRYSSVLPTTSRER